MDPLPYNITISSQTATISYLPARDGDSAAGWNLTYSQGTRDTGYGHPQGVGTDVRWTTLDGATMQLSWVGTAVYLYGQAFSASYTVDVDGDRSSFSSANVPQGGLLGSKTGLSYGNHTATLTTHGTGEVSLQFAQLTVGVGYPGSSVQNRTVLAVDSGSSNPIPNTFFTYQGIPGGTSWHIEDAKSQLSPSGVSVPVPLQMVTSTVGESVSFTLEQTTAFFLYGSMNFDHGQKLATLTPHSDPSKARTTVLNDYSSALDFFQIIYWEAGLDRNEHYSVQITQVGQAPGNIQPSFGFHSLLIMDGGSPSNATDPGSGTNPGSNPLVQPDSSKLSTGAIVGIVV
ncbi:hypothetical protein BXZ70DRAFT_40551 [Cristinia sonorae]|uniref:Uncharacterized protein n=1 Tax=Cristinia sonorae TaxID=1940300 RepID=A0A8K0UYE7_9AGAR|nr:hypothetical protein BXZ70DRAFT_40551 [Cristinia sonorae]